jgi:hypothetical protein
MRLDGLKDRTVRAHKNNQPKAEDREDRNRGQIDARQDPPHRARARPEGNEISSDPGKENGKENDDWEGSNQAVYPISSVL